VARWGLGVEFPTKVSAIGGHFMFDDDQETPNTLNVACQFDLPGGMRRTIEFEVRHWISNHEALIGDPSFGGGEVPVALGSTAQSPKPKNSQVTIGNIFYGYNGCIAINGSTPTGVG